MLDFLLTAKNPGNLALNSKFKKNNCGLLSVLYSEYENRTGIILICPQEQIQQQNNFYKANNAWVS